MIKLVMKRIYFVLIGLMVLVMSCSINKINFSQFELSELNSNGYKVFLDSQEIDLVHTYLDEKNILKVSIDRKNKIIQIIRKNDSNGFIFLNDLLIQKKYKSNLDRIVINNLSIDFLDIPNIKFELGSVKYIKQLTQHDYLGKDFDDLPQVKNTIGNGMLIINTITISVDNE
ncbi:hypothetical protein FGL01_19310 [Flavobacterium glycines]|uniref:Lipoprotein n=2 Tax=Flavobacterium glycines TaxID=551990 RepID=A0A1B9DYY9_9FLAO|nr:hypothetical protein FBGL_00100 [Flavobacterium glycines]GEL11192.1 hypothetical protein FGL01_19310 [Flavobacterium glycines]